MSFKRSPSKVWWGSESLEFREVTSSPGSQDSGFSDAEGSPQHTDKERKTVQKGGQEEVIEEENNNVQTPKKVSNRQIAKNIFKGSLTDTNGNNPNLSSNFKEKITPVKENIDQRLVKSERKSSPHFLKKFSTVYVPPYTEPPKKNRFIKNSPKVSRNLFTSNNKRHEFPEPKSTDQHSNHAAAEHGTTYRDDTTPEEEEENSCQRDYDTSSEISGTKSVPLPPRDTPNFFRSAPESLLLHQDTTEEDLEAVTSFNSTSSESELEHLFEDFGRLGYTSTPNKGWNMRVKVTPRAEYLHHGRVPPVCTDGVTVDDKAVMRWLEEARLNGEQECMTSLQFKSISGELGQRVGHLAACATTILRGLLSHSRCIEMDYRSLNGESDHIHPLTQSLAGNIVDFLKSHTAHITSKVLRLHDRIRTTSDPQQALELLAELFAEWESNQRQIVLNEVKKLVDKLEDPTSDLDLRATLTGITSVALRNPHLIEMFVKCDVIPILLILCEKCDGSSVRTLILRALSTMCGNAVAIRHFEKFSGVQIVSDTLEQDQKPEPERSEAVALLAQVTAPWLEDNHSIKGLQDYSASLCLSLTKFCASTKCCQNLLLCAAALANLSSINQTCIPDLVRYETAPVLLTAVKQRGPMASVYLYEQVATLLANMSALEAARDQLTDYEAVAALLHFLRPPLVAVPNEQDVERRLQQKSVIALSRLCSNVGAATRVAELGGVERLVRLCREKKLRFGSDAVLVAALATLRKIAEACGTKVLSVQDCQELVEPKLLDSFLAYSTQNESYV
ncbi:protein inscuteable homolog isoform X2 [Anthonomus grandis grandis]|nr:protein inscuteable homolog isoform X2 [Anthonomus grandis grandis]